MSESIISASSQLVNQMILNDNSPKFYRYYPRLFFSYFNELSEEKITSLCNAGYLYYHATLLLDKLIDEFDFSALPKSILLQEETIKILTSIYGLSSSFWELWDKRKQEYFEAVQIEKNLKGLNYYSFEEYSELADMKAAFGKVAIDCVWFLSDQKSTEVYHALLKSHKHFSIGFQLCDDIKDFKEDITNGQFNWGGVFTIQPQQKKRLCKRSFAS